MNAHFTESDVLAVELKNQPGALAHVCERLAEEHISIDYAYCSSGGRNGKVFGIFKVSNLEKAQRILSETSNHRRLENRPCAINASYKKSISRSISSLPGDPLMLRTSVVLSSSSAAIAYSA